MNENEIIERGLYINELGQVFDEELNEFKNEEYFKAVKKEIEDKTILINIDDDSFIIQDF